MINTDYKIKCLDFLLDKSCLSERYYLLIAYKETLIPCLLSHGCKTKSDIQKLSDDDFAGIGLNDADVIRLFRKFLTIYDPSAQKFREIEKLCNDGEKAESFRELYCLPGVKYTRANLYYLSGYKTLFDIASSSEEEILRKTAKAISENSLDSIVPLPKEVRTHIAVAKAFIL